MSDRFYKKFAIPYELYDQFSSELRQYELLSSRTRDADFWHAPLLGLEHTTGGWVQHTTVECDSKIGLLLTLKYGQYITGTCT